MNPGESPLVTSPKTFALALTSHVLYIACTVNLIRSQRVTLCVCCAVHRSLFTFYRPLAFEKSKGLLRADKIELELQYQFPRLALHEIPPF